MNILNPNHPFYNEGLRPFYFFTAIAATIFPTFWISYYSGYIPYWGTLLTSFQWHAHEMIFAFFWSLLAGYILTESPRWTKQNPFRRKTLYSLAILWLLGRIGLNLPTHGISTIITIILAMMFPVYFTFLMYKYLWNRTNLSYLIIPGLSLFTLSNFGVLVGAYIQSPIVFWSQDLALGIVRFFIVLISSKVIGELLSPKADKTKEQPIPVTVKASLIMTTMLCIPLLKQFPAGIWIYSILSLLTAIALTSYLLKQQFYKHLADPFISMMSVGLIWVIVNLILEAKEPIFPSVLYTKASLHALTAGAMGSFSIGLITLGTLTETGRERKIDKVLMAGFISMYAGAFLRVYVPIFHPTYFKDSLHHASGWWTLAYCLFLYRAIPYLFKKNLKETRIN